MTFFFYFIKFFKKGCKIMKFAFTADLHLKVWNDKIIDENGIPLKLKEILNCFRQICQHCKHNQIENIIIGGDVNDLKNIVHYKSFVLLKEIIEEYDKIHFYIIHGNHDSAGKEDLYSAIQLLNGPSNVTTFVEKSIIDDIVFIPWSGNMVDEILECEPKKILISHFGLNEAQLSSGISIKTNIKINNLKKFDLVLLGHYHRPQQLANVYYVGSPIQLNRGEADEEKRFLVVNSETLEVESHKTMGYRKYFNIVLESKEELDEKINDIKELQKEGMITIKNKIKDLDLQELHISEDVRVINEVEEEYQLRGITSDMKITEQMKKYLEIQKIPEDQHQEYIDVFLEIVK